MTLGKILKTLVTTLSGKTCILMDIRTLPNICQIFSNSFGKSHTPFDLAIPILRICPKDTKFCMQETIYYDIILIAKEWKNANVHK